MPEDAEWGANAWKHPEFLCALQFFSMLKSKGFGVQITDYNGRLYGEEEFDYFFPQFELLDSWGKSFITFDFKAGKFHRISGTDSTGWSGDEVDMRKY